MQAPMLKAVDPPQFSSERLQALRNQLVEEIRRMPPRRSTLSVRGGSLQSRVIAVAAGTILLASAGAAFAVTKLGIFDGPAAPKRLGPVMTIASGADWTLNAWRSSAGICLAIQLAHSQGAEGCGFPVAGATKGGDKAIAGLVTVLARFDHGYAAGLASARTTRVDANLVDGATQPTRLYSAPSALDLTAKIYFVEFSKQDAEPIAFTAFDKQQKTLGRWVVPQTTKKRIIVNP